MMPDVRQIELERIHLTVTKTVSNDVLADLIRRGTFRAFNERLVDGILMELRTWLWDKKRATISVHREWPATWWDALKERWFPKWLTRRFPVEMDSVHVEQPLFEYVTTWNPSMPDGPRAYMLVEEFANTDGMCNA